MRDNCVSLVYLVGQKSRLHCGCLGLGVDTPVLDQSQLGRITHSINPVHVFLCSLVLSQIPDVQVVLLC